MLNVAIIGAGSIGSRHLQGLCLSNQPVTIYVIDPSRNSLESAKQKSKEITHDKTIHFSTNFFDLPAFLFLAIIATSSNDRLQALTNLLRASIPQFLVLEKIAFTSVEEFHEAENLILNANSKTWVNCPRRMNPTYEKIKNFLKTEKKIQLHVSGSDYGLACNAIHFIDLFAYLSNGVHYRVDYSLLDNKIYEAKRQGYKEISGTIIFSFEHEGNLQLSCKITNKGRPQFSIEIKSEHFYFHIDEINQKIFSPQISNLSFQNLYQSQLTSMLLESLINNQSCLLPDFETSKSLHIPFLRALKEFFYKNTGIEYKKLPIT